MDRSRRSVLKGGAGLLAASTLAGCSGALTDEDSEVTSIEEGYAAFFTLSDWTQQVAGDTAEFQNPVGTGEIGHGWNPPSDLPADVAGTDAFVYLDTVEFSWAQDLAATLEADYDSVATIDAMAAIDDGEFLDWDHNGDDDDHDDDHDDEHDDDHDDHDDEHDDDHDDHDDDHDDEHDDHDDHDHDDHDPHVWVDPVLAQEMVDGIASEFAEIDSDNADTYFENAEAYNERLAEVDQAFENVVADADRDVAVLAGHDSFQYIEHRYGFELHTPVGISPDADPSQSEIADTIDLVDEEGIDTILYDPFEATEGNVPNLAQTIVENSDATETAPLSPAEGTIAEWNDEVWGYVEQMLEVNVESLRAALGAE